MSTGMARHGFDLQLTRYGEEGWRATFYAAGIAHSFTAAVGSAWEPTGLRDMSMDELTAAASEAPAG